MIKNRIIKKYKIFGKCMEICNERISLIVTLDVGPRIISLKYRNGPNLLFEDLKDIFQMKEASFKKIFKKETWHCYGGHRLWSSPESYFTYAPDNLPVNVHIHKNKYTFTAPKQPITNLIMSISVSLKARNQIIVNHTILNDSNKTITLSPWSLTSFPAKATGIYKFNDQATGFSPNRKMSIWSYSNLNDERLFLGDKYGSLYMNSKIKRPIKLGWDNQSGLAGVISNNHLLLINYTHHKHLSYPDNGCSLETYTNDKFLEIEILGPTKTLKPNHTTTLSETWTLIPSITLPNPKNESSIAKLFNK